MRSSVWLLLALGCAAPPIETAESPLQDGQVILGHIREVSLLGAPQVARIDADEPVLYHLWLQEGSQKTPLPFTAIDATLDEASKSLIWLSSSGELFAAPVVAPSSARSIARGVIYGLSACAGKLAYTVRVDGPETATFLYDLQNGQRSLLEDAPGSDEVLALSPGADKALILSSRTGLSSLYQKNIRTNELVQLTNVGLRAGPSLDLRQVAPNPTSARDVSFGASGIAYRSQEGAFLLRFDGKLSQLPDGASLAEAVQ